MANVEPLSATEEALWRALMRIALSLPRRLDRDLAQAAAITANEYVTLSSLSEARGEELRMAELAHAAALSASRMTRLVDGLQTRGLVTKLACAEDARGNVAKLTSEGRALLDTAWPAHLSSARTRVFDHIDPTTIDDGATALSVIAVHTEGNQ